ncbi:acetyltransferase, GNAT family [Aeromicrobium marinum DSM 15272]|uniref:Acetyltransferase, GNAT family n=1 Tax=Aeromicrobium marinum DSM 15272 TaxID=585531 RepID=E2SEF4_9ACTN|nr:GNAT family N-acetyltransferase [Aeromicrobium marinum]EFQ82431.1 acetyltransferase, GNAT family [Aeromicrobium marinum DSM 15272]
MPTADVSARLAWPDDARAIAGVQLAAWQHDRLLPDGVPPIEVDDHAARWEATLTRSPEARFRVLVGLERASVRGVVVVHPSTDPDADPVVDGEIGELLVHPDHRSAGHGSRLVQAAVDTLVADGFTRARWWIMAADDARRAFAESAGWAADGAHRTLEDGAGHTVKQVRLHTALS